MNIDSRPTGEGSAGPRGRRNGWSRRDERRAPPRGRLGAALHKSRLLGALEVFLVGASLTFVLTVPIGMVVAGLSLRLRGMGLRSIGWSREGWKRGVLLGLVACVLYAPLEGLVVWPVLRHLAAILTAGTLPPDETSPGGESVSSLLSILFWTSLVAPLLEESIYRGYMLPRAAGLFGLGRRGWVLGLLLSSLFFGLAHPPNLAWPIGPILPADDGTLVLDVMYSLIVVPLFALVAGALYLVSGRKLIAPFVFHASVNGYPDLLSLLEKATAPFG